MFKLWLQNALNVVFWLLVWMLVGVILRRLGIHFREICTILAPLWSAGIHFDHQEEHSGTQRVHTHILRVYTSGSQRDVGVNFRNFFKLGVLVSFLLESRFDIDF